MEPTTIDPAALLTRERTARALSDHGYPTTAATLATMATRGGGPSYSRFGNRTLYRWSAALGWAQGRLSAERATASEHEVAA
jgi:hypothetical protein